MASPIRSLQPAVLAALVVAGLGLAACAEEEPVGFTADNRSGFLAACTQPLEDTRLTSALCQCVFDETQSELSFERFQAIETELLTDPEQGLPPELAEIVARCAAEEFDL